MEQVDNWDAYVRRIIVNLATDSWRARRRRPELLFTDVDVSGGPDANGSVEDRDVTAHT